MFTPEERQRLVDRLLEAGKSHPRITGGAITGSGSVDRLDRWSDIDLAFGVKENLDEVLAEFTDRMYRDHAAVHHTDVRTGSWIYRVFLLASTLQVDLAFAPEPDFGPRAPTFRLVFGSASAPQKTSPPDAEALIGMAWLYALHVRSSLERGKVWQAEHMLGGMRNQVLALACVRHGLPAREGRGLDQLPAEITAPLEATLVASLDPESLWRSFAGITAALLEEARALNPDLASRLTPTLEELALRK